MDRFTLDPAEIADLDREVAIPGAIRAGVQSGDTHEHIVMIVEIINGG